MFVCYGFSHPGNGVVRGKITDQNNIDIPGAQILIKNIKDSLTVRSTSTNPDGVFAITDLPMGEFFLEIRYYGYATHIVDSLCINKPNAKIELNDLKLIEDAKQLKEIVVSAEIPLMENKNGSTVVNVDKSSLFQNSNLLEVLEKSPGVSIGKEGTLLYNGKSNVIILLDGKNVSVNGQEVLNILKAYQSSSVLKIEFSNSVGSKYDAAGSGGVINIVTKKNMLPGVNGSFSTGYSQGRYGKNNNALNVGYRNQKINLFVNYGYSTRKGFSNLILTRTIDHDDTAQTRIVSRNYAKFPIQTHSPRLNFDYTVTKKLLYSLIATGNYNCFRPELTSNVMVYNENDIYIQQQKLTSYSNDKFGNFLLSQQFTYMPDTTERQFTLDIDIANYYGNSTQNLFSTSIQQQSVSSLEILGKQKHNAKAIVSKIDYRTKVFDNIKLEIGVKSSLVNNINNNRFFNYITSGYAFDSTRSNYYNYSENINAAYLSVNNTIRDIQLIGGLRVENTNIRGNQISSNERFSTSYIQVFPSFNLMYAINRSNSFGLTYGRRIDRPDYKYLNPYRYNIDAISYDKGNPKLRPQLSSNFELTYSFRNSAFINAGYNRVNNIFSQVILGDGADNSTTIQTYTNIGAYNYSYVNATYTKKLFKVLRTNNTASVFFGNISPYNSILYKGNERLGFSVSSLNSIMLKNELNIDIMAKYASSYIDGLTVMGPSYFLNVAFNKKVFKMKGTIGMNFSDMCYTILIAGITTTANVVEDWKNYRDTRTVTINFVYKFGSDRSPKLRRESVSENELKRIG